MSSCVEADGIVAAAVALPVVAAYGVGWLAWQGGKLFVEASRNVGKQIAEKKQRLEEAERCRKMAAIAAHNQLIDICTQIYEKLESGQINSNIMNFAEIEQLKIDLMEICKECLPDDVSQIESLTSLKYLKLDKIVRRQKQLSAIKLSDSVSGVYQGLSVADLMDDLRTAVGAMEVSATKGNNVVAPDPNVLERIKLNKQFSEVTAEIMEALETIGTLFSTYGSSASGSAWFHSCFNGIDTQIELLCKPSTSNTELKKGIKHLRDSIERYRMLEPSIEKDLKRITALYEVYVDASKALGEPVLGRKEFRNPSEIEDKLKYLKKRADKAKECAEIYKKLGPMAYLCYAWDQELRAMGYEVHSRKKISEMANNQPIRAELGDYKLPYYQWNDSDLTQLYSLSSQCALQVIVHDNGTVSMQTIADDADESVVHTQRSHCAQLKALHKRLKENWFVLYDYEETESPNEITTVLQWRNSEENAWKRKDESIAVGHRSREKQTKTTRHMR